MRSRRAAAERLLRMARPRRVAGTIFIALGMTAWVIAAFLPSPGRSLGVTIGGALVAGGIVLIATSV
jgi:hypothetical protein